VKSGDKAEEKGPTLRAPTRVLLNQRSQHSSSRGAELLTRGGRFGDWENVEGKARNESGRGGRGLENSPRAKVFDRIKTGA